MLPNSSGPHSMPPPAADARQTCGAFRTRNRSVNASAAECSNQAGRVKSSHYSAGQDSYLCPDPVTHSPQDRSGRTTKRVVVGTGGLLTLEPFGKVAPWSWISCSTAAPDLAHPARSDALGILQAAAQLTRSLHGMWRIFANKRADHCSSSPASQQGSQEDVAALVAATQDKRWAKFPTAGSGWHAHLFPSGGSRHRILDGLPQMKIYLPTEARADAFFQPLVSPRHIPSTMQGPE